jgi:5-methylcytosine-specific restriction protein A
MTMPRALRFCSTPRCPSFATHGAKCEACALKADRARGTAAARGYDAAWATYSHGWLALHRWCGERQDFRLHVEHSRCAQLGQQVRAVVTDHITALRAGGARLDPANHQSLCRACHAWKTATLETSVLC